MQSTPRWPAVQTGVDAGRRKCLVRQDLPPAPHLSLHLHFFSFQLLFHVCCTCQFEWESYCVGEPVGCGDGSSLSQGDVIWRPSHPPRPVVRLHFPGVQLPPPECQSPPPRAAVYSCSLRATDTTHSSAPVVLGVPTNQQSFFLRPHDER